MDEIAKVGPWTVGVSGRNQAYVRVRRVRLDVEFELPKVDLRNLIEVLQAAEKKLGH